ncbi:MAG: hypothetical protein K2M60_08845, partial [Lachnospiraceae bacterium]|nr:hypothetical protein [Lachnospiraceae bacterium]
MKEKNNVRKDIRRSVSLLLALTLIFSLFVPVWTDAGESDTDGFCVWDSAKSIGLYYYVTEDLGEMCVVTSKYVFIKEADGFNLKPDSSLQLTGEVCLLGDDNKEYTLFSYRGNRNASDSTDDLQVFTLKAVFYDDNENEIPDDNMYRVSDFAYGIRQNDANKCGIYGFHPDFREYMIKKFGEENVNAEKAFSFLTSAKNIGKLSVKYTLTDEDGKTGIETVKGYSALSSEVDPYSGVSGYKLNYSRIENMADYHSQNTYNYLKMYKGDLYADADKISDLSEDNTITLPNYNRTGLCNMNSINVNG